MVVRPALVLTGAPAVGKSTAAAAVAAMRTRCAVVEVDDLRQLVREGGAAPWEGEAGARQRLLGARNACALASNFLTEDIDVLITDVLIPDSVQVYRELLAGCLVVRLTASVDEARRRAASRHERLTATEFDTLHHQDEMDPPPADLTIDVTGLDPFDQAQAIELGWACLSIQDASTTRLPTTRPFSSPSASAAQ